jgi:hypothetical protein
MRICASALLVAACIASDHAAAQRSRFTNDRQIVEQAALVASGERVEIFQHGARVDAAFLPLAEKAYSALEGLVGRKLDTATLGPKIRIYVSSAVTVSHLWRGYNHPQDPKGIVFLNPWVYQAALRGTNAT